MTSFVSSARNSIGGVRLKALSLVAATLIAAIAVGRTGAADKAVTEIISTGNAPRPVGPYSQGVRVRNTLYVAGQIAIDPATQQMISGASAAEQTQRALANVKAIVEAAGMALVDVVSTTIYVKDLGEFEAINKAYAAFFPSNPPARATVEVARLPKDAKVEISAIAMKP